MKNLRRVLFVLAAPILAFLWVELGLRGAALLWRAAYRTFAKPATFPVYVIGESTSYGEPFAPKIGFPRILSLMFGARLRSKPLEIVNLAKPGTNTEAQYWVLLRELTLRPRPEGLVLVYAGINDAGQERPPRPGYMLADRSWLLSRIFFLLHHRLGLRRNLGYEHHLAKLLALARGYGYPIVISTLVGNVRDYQPDISAGAARDPIRAAAYKRARQEERLGHWRAAARIYAALAAAGPDDDAGFTHREARCLCELGQYRRAQGLFQEAIDQGDALRPTTEQDRAIRRLAHRYAAALADTRALFRRASAHGLPGYDLFMDAHHPNLRGYLLLAASFARETSRLLGAPIVHGGLSEPDLRRVFEFSERDQREVYASRFVWFCGVGSFRNDRADALRMAQRYLRLTERYYGHRLPAYRFLLALLAHDQGSLEYWLSRKDAVRADREHLESMIHNKVWISQLFKTAGLQKTLALDVQKILEL